MEKLAIDRKDERGPRQPSGVVGLDLIHLSLLGYFQTPFPPRIGQWLSCISCNLCPFSGCPTTLTLGAKGPGNKTEFDCSMPRETGNKERWSGRSGWSGWLVGAQASEGSRYGRCINSLHFHRLTMTGWIPTDQERRGAEET